ncbi:MAG: hypothetical protein BZY77_01695 [SAR202 cluster bacterium Io17-Chloro-G5]|nr:MAG: hypothetical protein BZY77_01695 [SAR202 cluster bacterium Io17-Chloro-G5]
MRFDGTESADSGPISNRSKTFRSRKISIQEDHPICVHSGFCRDTVFDIWSMRRHSSDPEVLAKIIDKLDNRPSGALAYPFGVWRRDNRAGPEKIRDSYVGLNFGT